MARVKKMKPKGIAALFNDEEIKTLFKKYLVWIAVLEAIVLLVAWIYQLGLDESSVAGTVVDVPFPWKEYFLVAFLSPVAVTFLVGLVVVAFNKYVYGNDGQTLIPEEKEGTRYAKVVQLANFFMQLPFLISLIILAAGVGIVYNFGHIINFFTRFGEATARLILISLGTVLGALLIFLIIYMIIQYKLRKKEMEFSYKREVMDRLGIAVIDNKVLVSRDGQIFHGQIPGPGGANGPQKQLTSITQATVTDVQAEPLNSPALETEPKSTPTQSETIPAESAASIKPEPQQEPDPVEPIQQPIQNAEPEPVKDGAHPPKEDKSVVEPPATKNKPAKPVKAAPKKAAPKKAARKSTAKAKKDDEKDTPQTAKTVKKKAAPKKTTAKKSPAKAKKAADSAPAKAKSSTTSKKKTSTKDADSTVEAKPKAAPKKTAASKSTSKTTKTTKKAASPRKSTAKTASKKEIQPENPAEPKAEPGE